MTNEERELRRSQREHARAMEEAAREAGRGPIDVPFLLLVLLLTAIGLVMLFSASFPSAYYETGKTLPSIEVLEKLSAVYNTSIDVIVDNEVTMHSGMADRSFVAEGNKDPLMYMHKDEQTLVMVYRLLDEKGKEAFMKMAEQMLEDKND